MCIERERKRGRKRREKKKRGERQGHFMQLCQVAETQTQALYGGVNPGQCSAEILSLPGMGMAFPKSSQQEDQHHRGLKCYHFLSGPQLALFQGLQCCSLEAINLHAVLCCQPVPPSQACSPVREQPAVPCRPVPPTMTLSTPVPCRCLGLNVCEDTRKW